MKKITHKLWGAAFEKEPSEAVITFTAGRDVVGVPAADTKLLPYDLWANKAHCVMLATTGIIPNSDAVKILKGLMELEKLVKAGKFTLNPIEEDVHTNIESWLTSKLGIEVAGKIHTARSRNDQVVTDMRLYLRDQMLLFISNSIGLMHVLIKLADAYKGVLTPGFTHHQHAMVTTFGHVLAGFAAMVCRDIDRLTSWNHLHNLNPLGNAVAYGTSFPVNKALTAKLLGFDGPDINSLDAITNRWEPEADLAFAVVTLMNHLSLISETLILMSTPEFGMIRLSDSFSTGSSIMPQKKNPDPLEVMKGKTGFVLGQLMSLLAMGKGNFIGYNRDSQWTKYIIMDLCDQCADAPIVLTGVLETMQVNRSVMEHWCHKGFIGATTLMEQLVNELHIPMRQAKVLVEQAIKEHIFDDVIKGVNLGVSPEKLAAWQDPHLIISLTKSFGGPGKNSMKTILKMLKKKLRSHQAWLMKAQSGTLSAKLELSNTMNKLIRETNV